MSYWVDLLKCQVRLVDSRYRSRIIESGDGFPLVMLHGNGGHAENFVRNIPFFADYYRTIAMDFLWHGRSQTEGFHPEVLPPLVDQVKDLLDTLELQRVHLEGQSLGGWVAMLFALKYPERVDGLVLTTATGYVPDAGSIPGYRAPEIGTNQPPPSTTYLDDPSESNIRKRLEQIVFDPSIISAEAVALRSTIYSDPAVNRAQRELLKNYHSGEGPRRHSITDAIASSITQPTLVYWGDKNRPGPEVGRRLASVIPGAEFYSAPLTGHWAQFENSDQHNRVVLDFLRRRRNS